MAAATRWARALGYVAAIVAIVLPPVCLKIRRAHQLSVAHCPVNAHPVSGNRLRGAPGVDPHSLHFLHEFVDSTVAIAGRL
jgi:hypothetical protein